MARPQALRDALYYPTQDRVLDLFLDKVRFTSWSAIKLLDPCIGEGTAVKAVADRLGREASVWGVELSLNRARKAARLFKKDQVWHGSFFDLKCEDSSFHMVFCNPPYHTSEEQSKRQEVDFLERITPLLCHYGVLIYVISKRILSDERFVDLIRSSYKVEMILDYPEPEVREFDQCFLVATKEDTNYVKGNFQPLVCSEVLESWTRVREVRVPANSQVLGRRLFQVTEFDPERWKDKLPVYSNSAWATLSVDAHQAYRQPLVAPRFGHQAMLLTAGQLNGADLGGFLVKGGTEKVTTRTTDGDTLTERESLVSRISTISMETGEFDTWLVSDEPAKTVEWFEKNGTALAKAMVESHTPQFDGEVSPWASKFATLKAPGKLWGREKEEILDLQKQAACAINQRWKSHKTVVLSGEMGVGKMQPIDEPVLTPNGWARMGDLKVGDFVIGKDGDPTRVEGVYPQGRLPVVEVRFNDGSSTRAGWDHNWTVSQYGGAWETLTTRQIAEVGLSGPLSEDSKAYFESLGLEAPSEELKWEIPSVGPVDYSPQTAMLHPSVQGNEFLRKATIPKEVLTASIQERIAVAKSILYHFHDDGLVDFLTLYEGFADQVIELIRSLGGIVFKTTLPNQRVQLRGYLKALGGRFAPGLRKMTAILEVGEAECVCIKVASPDSLYVTKDFIVTHNTTIGIVANELYGNPKTVVVGPTHLVKKWVREANKVVGRTIATTAKTLSEVDAFFASDLKLLVLSKDRAKLGARWRHTDHRFLRGGQKCPDCGKAATEFLVKALDGKEKGRCYHCKAPLWQTTPISAKGTKRWALAKYINQKYAHRYNLIIDEAHNYAGADSDQSRAVQLLSSGSEKILAMTGTLYGGRASAIFHLLYKVSPEFRARYGFKDSKTFVEHMGLFEKTYKLESQSSVYGYRRANTGVRVKEIAGMSPNLIPMLLPFCIFLKLKDLNVELPAYSEELLEVDPDPEIEWAYGRLKDQIMNSLRKYPRIMSSFLQAGLGYVDFAEKGEEIQAKNDDGEVLEVFTAPAIVKEVLPKDLEVLRLAKENKEQGGKTLVYMTQVITRDARGRVKRLLEKHGLKVSILDASVPPEDREEWLTKEVESNFDVLITNGRLVETGLDLIWANLIIQYGIEYSVPSLRQSIRRSWRLGQTRAVRVVFLSYRNTMQEIATRLIAKKMKAAELVDGDDIHGLAKMDESGNDFFLELAQEVFRGYC